MSKTVRVFMTPASPWTYIGGKRLPALAAETGARFEILPVDAGQVFASSGGLPLPKRHPARQAYRLVELARWRDHYGLAMNIQPAYFPVPDRKAALAILAGEARGLDTVALSNALMAAVWEQERNIADEDDLARTLEEAGFDGPGLLAEADGEAAADRYAALTREAIDGQIFGFPWYQLDGVPYWGQDRLDFVAAKLRGN